MMAYVVWWKVTSNKLTKILLKILLIAVAPLLEVLVFLLLKKMKSIRKPLITYMAGTAMSMSSRSLVKARNKMCGMAKANKAAARPISTFTRIVKV